MQQVLMSTNLNPADFEGNPTLWLNSQLKDARSQLQDQRHQNQNLQIELRALNDKRNNERKELSLAQEKVAESVGHNRLLCSNIEQLKIDFTNCLNQRQGLEKMHEQSEL